MQTYVEALMHTYATYVCDMLYTDCSVLYCDVLLRDTSHIKSYRRGVGCCCCQSLALSACCQAFADALAFWFRSCRSDADFICIAICIDADDAGSPRGVSICITTGPDADCDADGKKRCRILHRSSASYLHQNLHRISCRCYETQICSRLHRFRCRYDAEYDAD